MLPARRYYRNEINFVPLPYRGVSLQPYDGAMNVQDIVSRFIGREAYRRTEFVVLRAPDETYAIIAIDTADRTPLFAPITHVEVLALPEACIYVRDPATDCGNRSALAALASHHRVDSQHTMICEGKFDHVNFIHRPAPLVVKVVEVAPPEPPKLFELVRHVLSYADLPPILPQLERLDIRSLVAGQRAAAFLVPCRSGGLDALGAPVHYLDERPSRRQDWTLIGCERSLQFHRHYYGDEPLRIEMCPRAIAARQGGPTLLKCCLLEFDIEVDGDRVIVPWGSDLQMIERALRALAENSTKEPAP